MQQAFVQQGHKSIIRLCGSKGNSYNVLEKCQGVNGQVIENEVIKAVYDGKNMDIDVYRNGEHFSDQLKKKDIDTILSMKAHPLALEKRLARDFGVKHKTYKHGRSATKRNATKRNTTKRSATKRNGKRTTKRNKRSMKK